MAEPVSWAPRCTLAESPRWYRDRWWWVDASPGLVYTGAACGPASVWLSCGGRASFVHPAVAPGTMLVAHGAVLQYHRDAQDHRDARGTPAVPGSVVADLHLPSGWTLNDGIADPGGGVYIGVVGPDRSPDTGYLQRVRADGSLGAIVRGVGLSNGMALDLGGALLYHADSTERVVFAHQLDARGEISGSAIHLRFSETDGMPDGLATDVAGGLWVAVYGAGEVRRYGPDGRQEGAIELPVAQVTSVAIGGPDGRDVLMTTAREGYDEVRSAREPLAGRLFSGRSPHRAVPHCAAAVATGPVDHSSADR